MITIYGLQSSEDGIVRYIGQCKCLPGQRLKAHIIAAEKGEKTHKASWIRKVLVANHRIEYTILKENAVWNIDEIAFINQYKNMGFDLANSTTGGEGVIGYAHTKETRRKISFVHKGKKRPDYWKKKISNSHKWKIMSADWCRKISESKKGKVSDKLIKANRIIAKNRIGIKLPKSVCIKISIALKARGKPCYKIHPMLGRKHNELSRIKMSTSQIGRKHTEKQKKERSIRVKKWWANRCST